MMIIQAKKNGQWVNVHTSDHIRIRKDSFDIDMRDGLFVDHISISKKNSTSTDQISVFPVATNTIAIG